MRFENKQIQHANAFLHIYKNYGCIPAQMQQDYFLKNNVVASLIKDADFLLDRCCEFLLLPAALLFYLCRIKQPCFNFTLWQRKFIQKPVTKEKPH
jgi:hypothetical protein